MTESLQPVHLQLRSGYTFEVDFGLPNVPLLTTDATPPLGTGSGPDSEMLLMAAVGNCLAASLGFALRKYKNESVPIRAMVNGQVAKNEAGRLRVKSLAVEIQVGVPVGTLRLAQRAIQQYEDFCVVTQSLRAAIPVEVQVFDSDGLLISD